MATVKTPAPKITIPQPPLHPDLAPLGEHLLDSVRLAVEKAVAHDASPAEFPLPGGASLESVLSQRLRTRKPAVRQRAAQRTMSLVRAGAQTRAQVYGPLAEVDLTAPTPVLQQAGKLVPTLTITDPTLLAAPSPGGHGAQPTPSPPAHPNIQLKGYKQLQVRLRSVKCIDETDGLFGSESGDDEISLGIIRLDPDGEVSNMGTRLIGKEFDDNETVTFDPAKNVLASWQYSGDKIAMKGGQPLLVNGKQVPVGWPRTYGVLFLLAEPDNGGFPTTLKVACDMVRNYVVDKIDEAVAAAIAGLIGGAVGEAVGAAIGKVVGAVFDWVLGGIINFFIGIWEDDVFPTVSTKAIRENPLATFTSNGANVTTKAGVRTVTAHGGTYAIHFDWHLVK